MNRKVYLILGASSDLGIEFIKNLIISENDILYLHYFSSKKRLEEIFKGSNHNVHYLKADFSKAEEIEIFRNEILMCGDIPTDIIHFAAGLVRLSRFKDIPADKFIQDYYIQVMAVINVLQVFLPKMAKAKNGRVVFILSSCVINKPPKFMSSYVVNKYALFGLFKSLVNEYAEKNIRINAISPSMIDTKFFRETNEKVLESNAFNHPLKRIASVKDIVPSILFLLGEKSQYINGANIIITGGSEF